MRISYDQNADTLYIQFQEGKVAKTKKVDEGILIDLAESGKIFGIEIVGLSERVSLEEDLGRINIELPLVKIK